MDIQRIIEDNPINSDIEKMKDEVNDYLSEAMEKLKFRMVDDFAKVDTLSMDEEKRMNLKISARIDGYNLSIDVPVKYRMVGSSRNTLGSIAESMERTLKERDDWALYDIMEQHGSEFSDDSDYDFMNERIDTLSEGFKEAFEKADAKRFFEIVDKYGIETQEITNADGDPAALGLKKGVTHFLNIEGQKYITSPSAERLITTLKRIEKDKERRKGFEVVQEAVKRNEHIKAIAGAAIKDRLPDADLKDYDLLKIHGEFFDAVGYDINRAEDRMEAFKEYIKDNIYNICKENGVEDKYLKDFAKTGDIISALEAFSALDNTDLEITTPDAVLKVEGKEFLKSLRHSDKDGIAVVPTGKDALGRKYSVTISIDAIEQVRDISSGQMLYRDNVMGNNKEFTQDNGIDR